eukprot:6134043-Prymnesium_polylepis.1
MCSPTARATCRPRRPTTPTRCSTRWRCGRSSTRRTAASTARPCGHSGRWRGCMPLGTPARPAADVRAPSASSTASASRVHWQRGAPSSSAMACGSSAPSSSAMPWRTAAARNRAHLAARPPGGAPHPGARRPRTPPSLTLA